MVQLRAWSRAHHHRAHSHGTHAHGTQRDGAREPGRYSFRGRLETISATTNNSGLKVQAVLDTNTYQKNLKISDKEMKAFETRRLHRHEFHGDWNYTLTRGPDDVPPQDATRPQAQR